VTDSKKHIFKRPKYNICTMFHCSMTFQNKRPWYNLLLMPFKQKLLIPGLFFWLAAIQLVEFNSSRSGYLWFVL